MYQFHGSYGISAKPPNRSTSDQLSCNHATVDTFICLEPCSCRYVIQQHPPHPSFSLPFREQPTKLVNVDPSTQRNTIIPRIAHGEFRGALRVEACPKAPRGTHSVSCTRGILPCRYWCFFFRRLEWLVQRMASPVHA